METPFFDPNKSYYENWEQGPFGAFADGKIYESDVIPFGIPAGPLLNSKFIKAALDKGFDYVVYKTVRSYEKKANQWPNVVPVKINGEITLDQIKNGVVIKKEFSSPIAITNSFGNPSYPVDVWQPDLASAVEYAQNGQQVWGMIEGDNLKDWLVTSKLIQATNVPTIEANFSCPNESDNVKKLLCYDSDKSREIAYALKNILGDVPLILKISYFENQDELKDFVQKLGSIVDGFSAVNAVQAPVYNIDGSQALLGGPWRLKSGICGGPIKWVGLDMVKRLKTLRNELNLKYTIVGVGGVTKPTDYHEYRTAGADIVMSATGAMWNPMLAVEIKKTL